MEYSNRFQKGNKYAARRIVPNRPTIKNSFGAKLFQDQYEKIVAIAKQNNQSLGEVMRTVVDFYFDNQPTA